MNDDERETEIRRWFSNEPERRDEVFLLRRLDEAQAKITVLENLSKHVVRWEMCSFEGPPPGGYENWYEFCKADVFRFVVVRAAGKTDFEKPVEMPYADYAFSAEALEGKE